MLSIKRAAQRCCSGLLVAAAVLCGQAARADTQLWYNGDFVPSNTHLDSLANSQGFFFPNAAVYNNFVVPVGQTWTIDRVFSNDQTSEPQLITQAHWEIRTLVTVGNSGTLVVSATAAASWTATGRNQSPYTEHTLTVSGLNVVLGAGTYSLEVTPVGPPNSTGAAYLSQTDGTNSSGTVDTTAFFNSSSYGANFADASGIIGNSFGFSEGVAGASVSSIIPVPEPSSLLVTGLIGLGALVVSSVRRLRRPAA